MCVMVSGGIWYVPWYGMYMPRLMYRQYHLLYTYVNIPRLQIDHHLDVETHTIHRPEFKVVSLKSINQIQ